jgi:divalent metal cation (Fe/Co/Zn/Cd) transporter
VSSGSQLAAAAAADLEGQKPVRFSKENDPYELSARLKSPKELQEVGLGASASPFGSRTNNGGGGDGGGGGGGSDGDDGRRLSTRRHHHRHYAPILVSSERRRAKRVQEFYRAQNENIARLLTPVDEHRSQAREDRHSSQLRYRLAVHGSFAANVLLAGLQLYAAVSSRSLSFFTTLADAIFDPLSNVALMLSHRAVGRVNARRFPSGKARIETAGNIGFCFVMCALSLVLVVMSARVLLEGAAHERQLAKAAAAGGGQSAGGSSSSTMTRPLHLPSVVAVSIAFLTKALLFAYCWSLRNQYSQVRILWQDHRNDIFINGFGILTAIGGSRLRWWIDPAGALVLSVVIIVLWLRTAYAEFLLLIGVTANVELQQLITYICMSNQIHFFLFVLPRNEFFTQFYPMPLYFLDQTGESFGFLLLHAQR